MKGTSKEIQVGVTVNTHPKTHVEPPITTDLFDSQGVVRSDTHNLSSKPGKRLTLELSRNFLVLVLGHPEVKPSDLSNAYNMSSDTYL